MNALNGFAVKRFNDVGRYAKHADRLICKPSDEAVLKDTVPCLKAILIQLIPV